MKSVKRIRFKLQLLLVIFFSWWCFTAFSNSFRSNHRNGILALWVYTSFSGFLGVIAAKTGGSSIKKAIIRITIWGTLAAY